MAVFRAETSTGTVEVLDTSLEVLYAESCNNLKEALKAGVAAANKLLAGQATVGSVPGTGDRHRCEGVKK